ncbi:transglutaminase family protein [Aurantibacter crassamenti]|uniref:transglutaminase-like domain-containing protein n=1 Tax=Aurantibacter crassamenti TaxID=1837375 RepID=UPI00193A679F|nr:transglutaminase family protein [Aurantibacter crassamenti]MBM1107399.1 transglutaminase family protein [Aurantibacter crassamenti]
MSLEYSIVYKAENNYQNWVEQAHWQFLIIPEVNNNQEFVNIDFSNSVGATNQFSINGYGFKTIRVHPKQKFKNISFEATFRLIKKEVNPFDFNPSADIEQSYQKLNELNFKVDFEAFLKTTHFTRIPQAQKSMFDFEKDISIFENLQNLNHFVFNYLRFKTNVTDVKTTLDEIIVERQGVCQDFTHLFCAVARKNDIPARYVSGYLHQGNGYFGDSQMHAWAEAYIPKIGWVGFDPTNNLLANTNHIKVAHGKDYTDCSPLKGVVYTTGTNETSHTVQVLSQQQQ